MATYKVIQDIEAEDKLIWQLSFRQFVYALIAAAFLYFSYLFVYNGVWFMSALTLPVAFFTGFIAYPFGKDQPTEVWALARLRFLIKPKRRIWAQSGLKELVTITVPKSVEINRTDGLSQAQVKSRLQALADTIDSRGWTVKDIDDNTYQSPLENDSDRLISSSTLPSNVPDDLLRANDILDVKDNPIAQKMDELLTDNANKHRQELIDDLDKMREEESIKKDGVIAPSSSSTTSHSAYSLSTTDDDQEQKRAATKLLAGTATTAPAKPSKSTAEKDPDIINLARRNDLNVSVIGREINRARGVDLGSSDNEVTVSLR